MNLHDEIMNLHNIRANMELGRPDECLAYKVGHRDARHAAAELALAQDALMGELVGMLQWSMANLQEVGGDTNPMYVAARAALAKVKP
jgi:hypothetical protein